MTYNHGKFIEDALLSIDTQKTKFRFELVIGDDFSTDDTIEKIQNYKFTNPNLKVTLLDRNYGDFYFEQRKKKGRLFNFTNIIEHCTGKYIALLDGDDFWSDTFKLQQQVDILELNSEISLSFHNVYVENHRIKPIKRQPMHKSLGKELFTTKDLLRPCFIHTSSIVYRNFPDFVFPDWFYKCDSGDIPLILLLSLRGNFSYIKNIMSVYRRFDTGVSASHTGYKKIFAMAYLYHNFNWYTDFEYDEKISQALKEEVQGHLPEIHELRRLKRSKKVKVFKFLKSKWMTYILRSD
ncbi:glycosyltransferase [Salinimicrobium sp. TIG7-5_MAKvit]|uniref:glycosyltransferase family 2 protein n=1 Tax=Salinimicrobium sp. TIG7-5_MAKvit TaxID=3121289 RepID=UPI003C6E8D51